ncbi:MAG: (2Fe-2S)-binding protein [Gordonia sp. (in: high G+C Gram-positive bacteria)]
MTPELTDVLDELGGLTPYFALPREAPAGSPARPTRLLLDDDVAAELFAGALETLSTTELRVAVSWVFFDYAAHLWSVALGAAAAGVCVGLDPDEICWSVVPGGLVLSVDDPRPGDDPVVEVLDRQLTPLVDSWRRWVSAGLLWGNAASAARSSGNILGERAAALTDRVLDDPRLRGRLRPGDDRRLSCCLYYRTAAGGYCGDCALTPAQ